MKNCTIEKKDIIPFGEMHSSQESWEKHRQWRRDDIKNRKGKYRLWRISNGSR